jgi:hexosaminidase
MTGLKIRAIRELKELRAWDFVIGSSVPQDEHVIGICRQSVPKTFHITLFQLFVIMKSSFKGRNMIRFVLLLTLTCIVFSTAWAQTSAPLDVMPLPAKYQASSGELAVDNTFSVSVAGHRDARVDAGVQRFLAQLGKQTGIPVSSKPVDSTAAKLVITAKNGSKDLPELGEDESYTLEVSGSQAKLSAPNDLGVLHGLQTFLQLVRPLSNGFGVSAVNIQDGPRFPWRGLMIDCARHFMPIEVLKRNMDGMEAAKLNVLHLHLSDNQGFRFESKKLPKLQELGSDGQYYTQEELKDLVAYAAERGIRVMPEFDIPGHSTAWLVGYPEIASLPGPYQIERHWGIFDPALDPTRDETYKFLDKLISEIVTVFPDPYLHIGGDEVNGKQWSSSPKIQDFMHAHDLNTNLDLQAYFNKKLQEIVAKHKRTMVGWDEVLHPDLPKTVVVQSWRGQKSLAEAAKQGYRGLLSNGYYIDLMWPAERHYAVDPIDESAGLSAEEKLKILGGEACMWAEFVVPQNIDNRIWPRMAAISERFWSPAEVRDVESMYRRMYSFGNKLDWYGLQHNRLTDDRLERIAGGTDIASLKMLASVVEPVKDYTRESLHEADPATSMMPLNRLIDVVPAESETARQFRNAVVQLGAAPTPAAIASLRAQLVTWRDNDPKLQAQVPGSFLMKELSPLSRDVAALSTIGLQALDFMEKGQAPPADWASQQAAVITEAAKPKADLLIMIAPAIQALVERAAKTQTSTGN